MKAFNQMDYRGDACLKLLALEYRPHDPKSWEKRYASNSYLAKIYRAIKGHNLPKKPKDYPSPRAKYKKHLRASFVEAWLGEAYMIGGMDEVKNCWERMMVILGNTRYIN